jgi:hypothetical protein
MDNIIEEREDRRQRQTHFYLLRTGTQENRRENGTCCLAFVFLILYQTLPLFAVLRIRIRDPVPVLGFGIGFFQIPDPR